MIKGKFAQRFLCPACRRVLRRQVHGNVRRIPSYCVSRGRDVLLLKVAK